MQLGLDFSLVEELVAGVDEVGAARCAARWSPPR